MSSGLKNQLRFASGILRRAPFQCLIQVTNRCNMKCSFCSFWQHGVAPEQELTLDDYRKFAADLAQLGTFLISIEGGEPLLRPDLPEIVRIFAEHHLPVLFTNGWHVTPENARQLFAAGLRQVGVSIDFPDAARHDAQRGAAGAFERACQAIEFFNAVAPGKQKQVHVMSVLMRENQSHLDELLALSARLGAGHWLTLLSDQGSRRGQGQALPTPEAGAQLAALWQKHRHLHLFRAYVDAMQPFLSGQQMPACHAGEQSFNLDHQGNVSPCIERIASSFGNIRNEPLPQILSRMQQNPEVAACDHCWTLCHGFDVILGRGGQWSGWRDLVTRMSA